LFFSFVKKSLERICTSLQKQGTISSFDESTLKGAISKEKMQREIEWQRLHPGMDALLSHRKTNYAEKEDDDESGEENENSGAFVIDSDDEMEMAASMPKKRGTSSYSTSATAKRATTTSTRGRGRARGRGASAPALSMSTDAPPSLPSTPSAASRWPPRR
jgi:hypothetical protein